MGQRILAFTTEVQSRLIIGRYFRVVEIRDFVEVARNLFGSSGCG